MPERKESLIRCEQWLFNIFGETILDKWHLAFEFYCMCASVTVNGVNSNLLYAGSGSGNYLPVDNQAGTW